MGLSKGFIISPNEKFGRSLSMALRKCNYLKECGFWTPNDNNLIKFLNDIKKGNEAVLFVDIDTEGVDVSFGIRWIHRVRYVHESVVAIVYFSVRGEEELIPVEGSDHTTKTVSILRWDDSHKYCRIPFSLAGLTGILEDVAPVSGPDQLQYLWAKCILGSDKSIVEEYEKNILPRLQQIHKAIMNSERELVGNSSQFLVRGFMRAIDEMFVGISGEISPSHGVQAAKAKILNNIRRLEQRGGSKDLFYGLLNSIKVDLDLCVRQIDPLTLEKRRFLNIIEANDNK